MNSAPSSNIKFKKRGTIKMTEERDSKIDNQVNLKPVNPLKEQIIAGSGPPDNALNLPIPTQFDLSVTNASEAIQKEAQKYATTYEKKLQSEENIETDVHQAKVPKYRDDVLKPNTEFPPSVIVDYTNAKNNFDKNKKFVSPPNVISSGNNFVNRLEGSTKADFIGYSDDMDIRNPKDIIVREPSEKGIKITKESMNYNKLTYLHGLRKQCKDPIEEKLLIKSYMDEQPNLDIKYLGKNVRYGYKGWIKENICNIARKS